uniref:Trimeric intracellular cation channel type B n=1 Tax=Rhabditophanes sp. KR3021 TaxID=114890 RepID=A0AC35U7N3_9BILA
MGMLSTIGVDQQLLMDFSSSMQRQKMYPYFDSAHYLLAIISVRDDLGTNGNFFSRKHPLSCWLSSMIVCFAGSFLANFLLGEPPIAPFKRHDDILLASLIWYLVFYSPFDVVYKVAKFTPIKLLLSIAKEIQRAYKVSHGVTYAAKLYPNAYLVHIMVGTAKGAGAGIIKVFEQLVRGVWMPHQNEILRPSFQTKACVAAAIIFTMNKHSIFVTASYDIIYLAVVCFFVYFKFSSIFLNVHDAFAPFENLFCAVFMGGIWDALSRALAASRERRSVNGKVDNTTIPSEAKKDQ